MGIFNRRNRPPNSGGSVSSRPQGGSKKDDDDDKDPAILRVLVPVLIFKGTMKKALKDNGVKVNTNKTSEIAKLFYENIVKKHGQNHFDPSLDLENILIDPSIVAGIVKGILEFFKNLRARKDKGEKLPPALDKIDEMASASVQAGKDVVISTAKEEAIFQLGNYAPYIIGALILLILYFAFK